ncbi:MAG: hypothetical protein HXY35_01330 [Chloroflexi bacterium]|nr:hypothetical protein [Chloroflexota bacterium]
MDLSNISTIIGVLGAYFAVVFVLAVSVETILEPFTSIPWLRKKPNPDDILSDIKEWLPAGSDADAKAAAIQNLTAEYKATEESLQKNVQDLKQIADQAIEALGPDSKVTQIQKDLALKFASLRRQYSLSEKRRITILRVIAAAIGMFIAWELQIDTFDILGELFPPAVRDILTQPNLQLGGSLITGLAASAGSSFWHDLLSRARNLKETVQQVSR